MLNSVTFKEHIKKAVGKVTFTKANGTVREMRCTLQADKLPKTYGTSKPNDEVMVVLDTEANAWRSFRLDRVISYEKK